ncbi:ABC transporter ATP-binding protein [Puia dinghuensis]|uniref:ABC transporter ATP-binding protein n=2 Tax=Puia dinghuensis TaxID=1792502 RepID=A0A8J2UFT1_9BACT|nr:ABC transporter ATP-binding protein [Puia dinghuensis]
MDCGPTCLRMVAKYYGRPVSADRLRNTANYGRLGTSMLGLADAAESIGFKSVGVKLSFDQLIDEAQLPAILHWDQYHFVVLTPESSRRKLTIVDPAKGVIKLSKPEFLEHWASTRDSETPKGTVLLLEQDPLFVPTEPDTGPAEMKKTIGWQQLLAYIHQHKSYFFQLSLGLLLGSLLQLVFPYLTQSIVDTGINTHDLGFIEIVLAAQLMLLFSQTFIEFIRNRILLHVSTRINMSLLSSFWSKLLRLPMQFFDTRHPGDIIQRVGDHQRIESFLTGTALNTTFSILSLGLFSCVLLNYNISIFLLFMGGSVFYLIWIYFFLKYRRKLDYQRFAISSRENNAVMQMIYGMQEIKMNNAENTYRWAWEALQAAIFKINFRSLTLTQYQQIGAFFINQGKNILITYCVARLVIDGSLTLGTMLAIQYILGQLNGPVEQLISFIQQAQDAKLSIERLNDIHAQEDEEPAHKHFNHDIPGEHSIQIKNLSFAYPGPDNEPVLKSVSLTIPHNKVTAIVGMSGSGKTTLIKLLLRFYDRYQGEIHIGGANFKTISPRYWRSICGTVLQDSYIFNDTIRNNIAISNERIDERRLIRSCKIANILSFIESLPLGFYTKLGAEGSSMSGGQKQRVAIARAVYKDPQFVFFDEATNSLDANNERVILENLQQFFQNKTVVVVAHRLSTVKNADKIIVLDNGGVAEEGTHNELTRQKGKYYELVKNQLELGN